jgi:hypothetical protein
MIITNPYVWREPFTREGWMVAVANELRPAFADKGQPLPAKIRMSCGFPSKGARSKTIGECHYAVGSEDDHVEIFIRPDQQKPAEVGTILLHELVHAALPVGAKHGPAFKALATALGLEGKMTATRAGPVALSLLEPILEAVGPYPHAALRSASAHSSKPQRNVAMINVRCPGPDCDSFAKVPHRNHARSPFICPLCDLPLVDKNGD